MTGHRARRGWWLALPATLVYLPLMALPVLYSLALSLHRWDGLAAAWQWVGLANYLEMLADGVFWQALGHNVLLIVFSLLVQLPLALLLAVVAARAGRALGFFRTAVFLPYILPTVVIALVWRLLLNEAAPTWLGSARYSIWALLLVISWRFVGFHMVLYLAGISAIDPQLYEAARLDGAGEWACFRHVTLPLLRPVLAVSATLSVVGSIKYFDIVWVMTQGGPAHGSELLATYMYQQGLAAARRGYGSALAVTMVALALAAMAAVRLIAHTRRRR